MTRTFWLSFMDDGVHLGVCVVDVTNEDVEATVRPERATEATWRDPEVRWIAAAIQISWERACNPGGQVSIMELPSEHPVPRDRLLVGPELAQWGAKPTKH